MFSLRKDTLSGFTVYSTSSTGKLAFLNNLVGVFEYEADNEGTITVKYVVHPCDVSKDEEVLKMAKEILQDLDILIS